MSQPMPTFAGVPPFQMFIGLPWPGSATYHSGFGSHCPSKTCLVLTSLGTLKVSAGLAISDQGNGSMWTSAMAGSRRSTR